MTLFPFVCTLGVIYSPLPLLDTPLKGQYKVYHSRLYKPSPIATTSPKPTSYHFMSLLLNTSRQGCTSESQTNKSKFTLHCLLTACTPNYQNKTCLCNQSNIPPIDGEILNLKTLLGLLQTYTNNYKNISL